jgi:L-ascorbate metabolism protein UlaG (beta-lactamase superfamily)
MRSATLPLAAVFLAVASARAADPAVITSERGDVTVHPIEHASFVLENAEKRIAFDPVGGAARSPVLADADLVLVTDIHGDHFDAATLGELAAAGAAIVAPAAVADQMPPALKEKTTVLENGQSTHIEGIAVEAVPMYNITSDRHPKGRGNGYVITVSGLRIYVSGDTEDIPEMRELEDIDVAFVCMNLPYTMDVERAADAVVDFAPRIVYPYHYRGQDGLSDVGRFAELVQAENDEIEVRRLDWYPE